MVTTIGSLLPRRSGVALGLISSVVAIGGCDLVERADSNRAPVIEPLSLTGPEDAGIRFTLVSSDQDGDDLDLQLGSYAPGVVRIIGVREVREGGATRLETECGFSPARDFHGDSGLVVHVSDGTTRVDAFIDIVITAVNDSPIAVADSIAGPANAPVEIFHSTLLANDEDPDDRPDDGELVPLSITSVEDPLGGTVTLGANTITFTPNTDFAGTAKFEYTVSDGIASDHETVVIAVGAPNAAPVANDDHRVSVEGQIVVLVAPDLTRNDVDQDGQALAVIAVGNATHGTVEASSGTVTFTPESHFYGTGGFDYTATDGVATATAHVEVEIAPLVAARPRG